MTAQRPAFKRDQSSLTELAPGTLHDRPMTAISVSNAMGTFKIPPHSHRPALGGAGGESPETLMGAKAFSNDGYCRRKASAGSSLVALQAG